MYTHDDVGTTDVSTWRAVPADHNPTGNEDGAWAVVAGDGDESDVYVTVIAEHPKAVAEFIAAAVRNEAARQQHEAAVIDGLASRSTSAMPPTLGVVLLAEQVGKIAREVSADPGENGTGYYERLYRSLGEITALAVNWRAELLGRHPLLDGLR